MENNFLCPYCHTPHPGDSQFCPKTGKRLALNCPHCAAPVQQDWQNCPHCGCLLIQSQPEPQPAVSISPRRLPKTPKSRLNTLTLLGLVLVELIFALLIFGAYELSRALFTPATNAAAQTGMTARQTYTPMPASQASGRIAFVSDRDGTADIYVMNADGSVQTRLTFSGAEKANDEPNWSPDGSKIAFVSNRDGNAEIYVMNSDGANQTRLTANLLDDFYPTWSPDGQQIAYISGSDGDYLLWVMNADGSGAHSLKDTDINGLYISLGSVSGLNEPHSTQMGISWSSDGKQILYSSRRSGLAKAYLIDLDTGEQTALANSTYYSDPRWSPDGTKLLEIETPNGYNEIYLAAADGSTPRAITRYQDNTSSYSPNWSPDGQKIVFVSTRDGNEEIYVMNADGGYPTRVTDNMAEDWNPVWRR